MYTRLQVTTEKIYITPSSFFFKEKKKSTSPSQLGQLYIIYYCTCYILPNLLFGFQMEHYGTLVWCDKNCGLQAQNSDRYNDNAGYIDLLKLSARSGHRILP